MCPDQASHMKLGQHPGQLTTYPKFLENKGVRTRANPLPTVRSNSAGYGFAQSEQTLFS